MSPQQHPPSLVPPRSDSPVPGLHPPDISTFLSAIPDRLSQAIALYEKMLIPLDRPADAPPPDPDRSHPLVYVEACIRCAAFLLAVYEAHGSIPQALERLVSPPTAAPSTSSTSLSSAEQARRARFAALSPSNTVPRSTIALWLSQAYSPHLALLSLPPRLRLTAEIASLFGRIGYRRKEASVLRELAALCAEGVAGKSIEVFAPSGHSPIPEEPREGVNGTPAIVNGFKPADAASRPDLPRTKTFDRGGSIVRTMSDPAGNESIVRIVEKVCEAFGIQVVPRSQREEVGKLSIIQGRTVEIMESGNGSFGWPSLQIGVLKDAIGIAEALPGASILNLLRVRGEKASSRSVSPQTTRLPSASPLRPYAHWPIRCRRMSSTS